MGIESESLRKCCGTVNGIYDRGIEKSRPVDEYREVSSENFHHIVGATDIPFRINTSSRTRRSYGIKATKTKDFLKVVDENTVSSMKFIGLEMK